MDEFGPDSPSGRKIYDRARNPTTLAAMSKELAAWVQWRPVLDGEIRKISGGRVLKVYGRSEVREGQPYIGSFERPTTPASLLEETEKPIVLLYLAGNPRFSAAFARQMQYLADRAASVGAAGPDGVVLIDGDPVADPAYFLVVQPFGAGLQAVPSLDAALAAIKSRDSWRNAMPEIRARMNGYTRAPDRTSAEVLAALERSLLPPAWDSTDLGPELSALAGLYANADEVEISDEVADGALNGRFPRAWPMESVSVPIRRGAGPAEIVDAARLWLSPGVIRALVEPTTQQSTTPVRIGSGLRAHRIDLPADDGLPEVQATVVRPAASDPEKAGLWVNRSVPGAAGLPRLLAVPLDGAAADWAFLTRLPGEAVARLTIEPGRHRDGTIEVDGRTMSGAEYRAILPSRPTGPEPIVVLLTPVEHQDPRFVVELVESATVLLPSGNVKGRGAWMIAKHRTREVGFLRVNDLGQAIATVTGQLPANWDDAMTALIRERIEGPDSDATLRLRRVMAASPLREATARTGWVRLPAGSPTSGFLGEVLRHQAAGLVPLRPAEPRIAEPTEQNIKITVPARYVGIVPLTAGRGIELVDVHALAGAGALLSDTGRVTVDPHPPAPGVAGRAQSLLRERADLPESERMAYAVDRMLGNGQPSRRSLTTMAGQLGANFVYDEFTRVGSLDPGAITPIQIPLGGKWVPLLVVGTDRADRPVVLDADGLEVAEKVYRLPKVRTLIDGRSKLVQLRPSRTTDPPWNDDRLVETVKDRLPGHRAADADEILVASARVNAPTPASCRTLR